jgi:hypothetical protein
LKYSIDANGEFLRVTVMGRETDEPPSEVCDIVFREARRLGRNRILIELDQKAALSPASQLMLVNRLPQIRPCSRRTSSSTPPRRTAA